MTVLPEEAAREVLETIPLVMRVMRKEMRGHRQAGLSVPQFRSLAFARRHPGASLNSLAEHLGLTPASTSKLIDGLVERGFIERLPSTIDRRRITLTLTPQGLAIWEASFRHTLAVFTDCLSGLGDAERETLYAAMQALRPLFEEK